FERRRREQGAMDLPLCHPFGNVEEWELARWIIKNIGQTQTDSLLALPIVRLSYHNNYSMMKLVDNLPSGPEWTCDMVHVVGDRIDEHGRPMEADLKCWMRDPLDCIHELMGNPAFRDAFCYAPERAYTDEHGTNHLYDEMWTGNWWWDTQLKLPPGAVVAPIILSSDKTTLMRHRGDKEAWPVYLTLGNIARGVRCRPSSHANILIGYLPTSTLGTLFTSATQPLAKYRLFHYCMGQIMKPLIQAGTDGVEMTCPDGWIRRVHPILAAYIADNPEQCLIACCQENACPSCPVDVKRKGDPLHTNFRDPEETLSAIRAYVEQNHSPLFEAHALRAIPDPFWANLPHANIYTCFTPDLLHQLHNGVFGEHLVKWCTQLLGNKEIDARYERMSPFPGLRQFKSGISRVSQWTGREHQEMQSVFLGVLTGAVTGAVIGAVADDWMKMAKALLDFVFHARLHAQTTRTIAGLLKALDRFHQSKHVVINTGIREHFEIPKVHSMVHYAAFIESHGAVVGFNTETPERLHIDFAKRAYRATNKRDYTSQMTQWLRRQEAVDVADAYLTWCKHVDNPSLVPVSEGPDKLIHEFKRQQNDRGVLASVGDIPGMPPRVIRIAVKSPAPKTRTDTLITKYGALQFTTALNSFLSNKTAHSVQASDRDTFAAYHKLSVTQMPTQFTGDRLYEYHVHAVLGSPAQGRKSEHHPSFDTVLIVDPEGDSGVRGVPGIDACLRPARVRALFTIPERLGTDTGLLAYVELFTRLGPRDAPTGMFQVAPSTRNRRRHSYVIRVDDIVLPCHLVPKSSPPSAWPRRWKTHTVLDDASQFLVNTHVDLHTY
ncbi:hypothetical protein BC834DRAFT_799640, partial [Gloeopeniophorella convolvens]